MATEALQFGVREAFAIGRAHYSNIDLEAMSQGFLAAYTEEELDAIEAEVSPLASVLANGLKDDAAFPFPFPPK